MTAYLKALLLCFCLLLHTGLAQSQEDPRFSVQLAFENGNTPTLREQVNQALPVLWQRIIPKQALQRIPDTANAMTLLQRVRPEQGGSLITFNPARVRAHLEQKQIAYIRSLPVFNLQVHLINAFGNSMQSSERQLLSYAHEQAEALGVQFTAQAPLLDIRIQWLDDIQVQLSARGQSRLSEFSETRSLDMGDPFKQLQQWIIETVIRARDAYAWQEQATQAQADIPDNKALLVHLLVQKQASLSEQVALETALKRDPRVQSVVPTYLNAHSREYIVRLKQHDESWIEDWFAQRGMLATPDAQGWLIQ